VPVDIRILATSNRNLAEAARDGIFREDLLFRLNVVNLKLPPLRERPADVIELAQFFAKKYIRRGERRIGAATFRRGAQGADDPPLARQRA
jgi:DNA-binding NtrC family response regulator